MKENYLNNRDLLKEIHLSKNNYCSFAHPDDHQFDIILMNPREINEQTIAQAKKNHISRVERETGTKNLDENLIDATDLVFRVMTWEHIPMLPPKKGKKLSKKSVDQFFNDVELEIEIDETLDMPELDSNAVNSIGNNNKADHIKVNFPPFFHYRVDENFEPYLVGKSHWIGDLNTGYFSKTHGQMTNKLAHMIIKLTERFSSKSNWRNYSYRDEMCGQAIVQLSQVILQFNEYLSQNPFAYATTISSNAFLRILNIEKKNQEIRDDLLEKSGFNPSYSRNNQTASAGWEE